MLIVLKDLTKFMHMDKPLKNQEKFRESKTEDIGFSSKYNSHTQRLINRDGTFNVDKTGLKFSESFNLYHWLISLSWIKFFFLVFSAFIFVNSIFASVYFAIGVENLGISADTGGFRAFMEAYFFSAQTITTVGYGRISPVNFSTNIIASVESLTGLLAFAIATGLLYGRFSKPNAKIVYSRYAVISPFNDITGFMFRIANKHKSQIIDCEVQVVFSRIENFNENAARKFYNLKLEYPKIYFFASTWTVNHPINEKSPLYKITEEEFNKSEAEFLILLKGFDDTFAQNVHSRFSYRHNEVIWNAKYKNIHIHNPEGKLTIELDKISDLEKLN
jgi:inward rectifier potassium channel